MQFSDASEFRAKKMLLPPRNCNASSSVINNKCNNKTYVTKHITLFTLVSRQFRDKWEAHLYQTDFLVIPNMAFPFTLMFHNFQTLLYGGLCKLPKVSYGMKWREIANFDDK